MLGLGLGTNKIKASGGGSVVPALYQAVLDEATLNGWAAPNANGQAATLAFLTEVETALGGFNKVDVLSIFRNDGADEDYARMNFITPTQRWSLIPNSGIITYTDKSGFYGSAVNSVMTYPGAVPNWGLDDASAMFFQNAAVTLGNGYFSASSSGASYYRVGSARSAIRVNENLAQGMSGGTADGVNKMHYYGRSGINVYSWDTNSAWDFAPTASPASTLVAPNRIGSRTSTNGCDADCGFIMLGAFLTEAQVTAIASAWDTYVTATT